MKHNPLFPSLLLLLVSLPFSLLAARSSPSSPLFSPSSPPLDSHLSHSQKQHLLFLKSFALSFGVVLLPSIGNTIFLTVILLSRKYNQTAGVYLGTLCAQFLLLAISVMAGASLAMILHHKVINAMAVLAFTFFTFYFIVTGCRRRHTSPKQALLFTKHLLEVKGFLQTERPRQNSTESIVLYGIKTRDVEVSPMVLTPVPQALEEPLLPSTGETNTISVPMRASQKLSQEANSAFDHFLRQRRRGAIHDRRHLCVRCWDKSFFKCFCITLALHYLSAEQFASFTLAASLNPLGILLGGFVAHLCSKGIALGWGAAALHQASPKLLRVVCGLLCAFVTLQYFLLD